MIVGLTLRSMSPKEKEMNALEQTNIAELQSTYTHLCNACFMMRYIVVKMKLHAPIFDLSLPNITASHSA